jgi:hypothetical protein
MITRSTNGGPTKAQGGPAKAQGKGQKSITDGGVEIFEVRYRIWHRVLRQIESLVLKSEVHNKILVWVQNWILTLFAWYMPLPEGMMEKAEQAAAIARQYCPDVTAGDILAFCQLRSLPRSEAELQAVWAAMDPQGYCDFFKENPGQKRLYSPSRYSVHTIR